MNATSSLRKSLGRFVFNLVSEIVGVAPMAVSR